MMITAFNQARKVVLDFEPVTPDQGKLGIA